MYFGTRRCAHEAVGAVACFSEFSRLRNGCKVNVFRWIFCFLFAALACSAVFGKGGGVSTCEEGADVGKDGADVGKDGEDVGKDGVDVGKDGADVSVLRANYSLCRSLQ